MTIPANWRKYIQEELSDPQAEWAAGALDIAAHGGHQSDFGKYRRSMRGGRDRSSPAPYPSQGGRGDQPLTYAEIIRRKLGQPVQSVQPRQSELREMLTRNSRPPTRPPPPPPPTAPVLNVSPDDWQNPLYQNETAPAQPQAARNSILRDDSNPHAMDWTPEYGTD